MAQSAYRELYVTTKDIPRKALSELPFGHLVTCNRVGGWELWLGEETRLAGEYDPENWLVLDVDGQTIVDSRPEAVTIEAADHPGQNDREPENKPAE